MSIVLYTNVSQYISVTDRAAPPNSLPVLLSGFSFPLSSPVPYPIPRQPLLFLSLQFTLIRKELHSTYNLVVFFSLSTVILCDSSMLLLFINSSFLLLSSSIIIWPHHNLFIHSLDGHLGCFQFLAITNETVKIICA